MREVSLETLPNVNIRDPSHDKNLSIMSVTGSINQNVFKYFIVVALGEITYSTFTSFRVYLPKLVLILASLLPRSKTRIILLTLRLYLECSTIRKASIQYKNMEFLVYLFNLLSHIFLLPF